MISYDDNIICKVSRPSDRRRRLELSIIAVDTVEMRVGEGCRISRNSTKETTLPLYIRPRRLLALMDVLYRDL